MTDILDAVINQTVLTTVEVIIGALAGAFLTNAVNRFKERKTIEKTLEKMQEQLEATRKEFKEELAIVRSELMLEIAGLKKAESASLRHTIRKACKDSIHKGWIPLDEKEDVLNIVNSYESIVQVNSFIDDVVASMRELPNEKPKTESNQ